MAAEPGDPCRGRVPRASRAVGHECGVIDALRYYYYYYSTLCTPVGAHLPSSPRRRLARGLVLSGPNARRLIEITRTFSKKKRKRKRETDRVRGRPLITRIIIIITLGRLVVRIISMSAKNTRGVQCSLLSSRSRGRTRRQ